MNNMRPLLIGIGIAGFVLLGGWYGYTLLHPLASEERVVDFPYEKGQDGSRVYIEDTEEYHIDATYPDSAGIEDRNNDRIAVEGMELFIRQEIADFTTGGNTSPYERALSIGYTRYSSPHALSFVFTILSDAGGAHPITYFKTFVWGREGGALALGDILQGPYLSRLSALSKTQVRAHIEAQTDGGGATLFEEGFAPDAKNFQNFYLDGGELVILFDPYQVAAYAAGPQEARIPLSQIVGSVRPEFK